MPPAIGAPGPRLLRKRGARELFPGARKRGAGRQYDCDSVGRSWLEFGRAWPLVQAYELRNQHPRRAADSRPRLRQKPRPINAGVDGVLITDLVPEEAKDFRQILAAKDLALIMLAAPTSSDERLRKICDKASGFVYAVSRAGVTGARTTLSNEAESLVGRLRNFTDLPIAVGFGISDVSQVQDTWKYADAAVVGSAIVAEIARLAILMDENSEEFIKKVGAFAENLLP